MLQCSILLAKQKAQVVLGLPGRTAGSATVLILYLEVKKLIRQSQVEVQMKYLAQYINIEQLGKKHSFCKQINA
jgi:hypothetical protein